MTKGLVSVVLPIYKVDKYLECCIESVTTQSYSNLEIILVDDGSPDNCPKICDEWARKDERIKVVHKQNAGLGMARNTGIEHATGEYICFLDSDDYVTPYMIEKVYLLAKKTGADIVTYGFCNIGQDGKLMKAIVPKTIKEVYQGEEVQEIFLPDLITDDLHNGKCTNLSISAWASFYSMELIKRSGWKFVSEREIISEDVYSMLLLYEHVQKVAVLPEPLYYYRENSNSLSRTYNKDRYMRIRFFHQKCVEIIKELEYSESVAARIASVFVGFTIGTMKMLVLADKEKNVKKAELKAIVDDQYLQQILQELKWERANLGKKILLFTMKKKWYSICYNLITMNVRKFL